MLSANARKAAAIAEAAQRVGGWLRGIGETVVAYVAPGLRALGQMAATAGSWLRGMGEVVGDE